MQHDLKMKFQFVVSNHTKYIICIMVIEFIIDLNSLTILRGLKLDFLRTTELIFDCSILSFFISPFQLMKKCSIDHSWLRYCDLLLSMTR